MTAESGIDTTVPPRTRWGEYELRRWLGGGGMGVVYEAVRDGCPDPVALKFMKPELLADHRGDELVERFRGEADLLRSFRHSNVVRVSDSGVFDGRTPYIAMEVLTGGTLTQHLSYYRDNRGTAVRLVAVVARALHSIHRGNAVHRDLKPGNLMFRADPTNPDEVVITDFGLGVVLSRTVRLTITGHFMGTPVYSAPEQLVDAKHVDHRADVYSLGVILFQLVSGRLPVDPPAHRVDAAYIRSRQQVPARNLRDVVAGCCPDLDSICRACLQPEPNGRFDSAEVLADELDAWLATH